MKKLSFFLAAMALVLFAGCGTKRSQAYYAAPSQVLSTNYDGSYIIRVQVRSRTAVTAFTDAQRKAVQEVIFDGVKAGAEGLADLKPLCFDLNAREKHEAYFQSFFEEKGPWSQYVSLEDKRPGSTTYQRTGIQMIETVTVTVNRSALQRRLQADGIIPTEGRY